VNNTKPQSSNPIRLPSHRGRLEWMNSLSYAQRQRLRFFEARLLWEGQVNRQDVCSHFGVTANHFTREVRSYRQYFPDNVVYDVSARAYRPTDEFQAGFATSRPEEYLALLRVYTSSPSSALMAELGATVTSEVLPEPEAVVDKDVLRGILAAIHNTYGCEVRYQSFSSAGTKKRSVWPHALVWADIGWYVRVYDKPRNRYINLALSRISSVMLTDQQKPEDAGDDLSWLETEIVEVIPNPDLSPSQKRVIAKEYGMKKRADGYVWRVALRRCLIPYFLYRHRLDEDRRKQTRLGFPIQRIVVRDPMIIKRYAFPSD